MDKLDFGKVTTIVIFLLIAAFFFGDKAVYWYKHQNDLKFSLKNLVYTKYQFDTMDEAEKTILLNEVASLCIRKHYADGLECTDTAYWLANSLEEKGIDINLAMEWIPTCTQACVTGKKPVYIEEHEAQSNTNPVNGKVKIKSEAKHTQWIWEK